MNTKDQKLTLKYLKVEMDKIKEELNSTKECLVNVKNELNVAKEEIKSLKKTQKVDIQDHDKKDHKVRSIKCDLCDMVFSRNSDLELHLEIEHNKEKKFKCNKCEMSFVLNWRLQKHIDIHEEKKMENRKFCHYFNNEKECPFATLGCMFKHENAPHCKYSEKCLKTSCQFKHKNNEEVSEVHNDLTEEEKEFDFYVKTNFRMVYDNVLKNKKHLHCYFCDFISKSKILKYSADELAEHMDEDHEEIISSFDPDCSKFDNDLGKEFLKFLVIG